MHCYCTNTNTMLQSAWSKPRHAKTCPQSPSKQCLARSQTLQNRGLGRPWAVKCSQKAAQAGPQTPKSAQEAAKRDPTGAQERPRAGQECSKAGQVAPKRRPRASQTPPKWSLTSPKPSLAHDRHGKRGSTGLRNDFLSFRSCSQHASCA